MSEAILLRQKNRAMQKRPKIMVPIRITQMLIELPVPTKLNKRSE